MSGYCPDCGNTLCLCDYETKLTYPYREKIKQLEDALMDMVSVVEWIAKTDTASIVHGPDVLWLSNWRNTRKQAASDVLERNKDILEGLR